MFVAERDGGKLATLDASAPVSVAGLFAESFHRFESEVVVDQAKSTDRELVKQLRAGDTSAFEELVRRYAPKVFSLAARLTRNHSDSEEVLQDVFVTVHRKIHRFEGKSSFSSWLYRITVNASFMKLRKRRADRLVLMEELPTSDQERRGEGSEVHTAADRITARHELSSALNSAISELPEEYRPVFILRDIDGLTSEEVGKILKLSVPAVKSRLHRSRDMLRRKLLRLYREYAGNGRMVGNM